MGISTDAILAYGFRLKDEKGNEEGIIPAFLRRGGTSEDPDEDQGGTLNSRLEDFLAKLDMDEDQGKTLNSRFEDFLARLDGIEPPYATYDEKRYNRGGKYKKAWDGFWDKVQQINAQAAVELVRHCHNENARYLLAVKDSVQTANRGFPIELGQQLIALPEWRENLLEFCQRAGIQFEEPQWILASYSNY